MAFIVFKVLQAEIKAGKETASMEEMGWVGVCPVVVTREEALSLVGGKEEFILEIHSPSAFKTYQEWSKNNADET